MRKPLYIIREKGKYGFMDASGETVIEPQYFQVEDFYNGYSRILFNDKPVHLDAVGRLLMKHSFKYVGLFEENLAKVQLVNLQILRQPN